jgi:hypothetical protein
MVHNEQVFAMAGLPSSVRRSKCRLKTNVQNIFYSQIDKVQPVDAAQ